MTSTLAAGLFWYYLRIMEKKRAKRDQVAFVLRLPKPLHAALRAEAARENRSLNSQVIQILQERYTKAGAPSKK